MQDQRLNYVEQHAERTGVNAGRLNILRVSAAKGSIMGDTLDVCARQVDAQSLKVLVPVLSQLVKRGWALTRRLGRPASSAVLPCAWALTSSPKVVHF